MPTLHRLACFRDDVVVSRLPQETAGLGSRRGLGHSADDLCMQFVILLYQYWIYPVDKTRANEYGQTLEEKEPEKSDAKREGLKAEAVKESKKDR